MQPIMRIAASISALVMLAACAANDAPPSGGSASSGSTSSGSISAAPTTTAGGSQQGLPMLNATCPLGIEVHVDQGGPVFINGNEAELKKVNENYYEATRGDVTLSLSRNPDGTMLVSYTKRDQGNGVCSVIS